MMICLTALKFKAEIIQWPSHLLRSFWQLHQRNPARSMDTCPRLSVLRCPVQIRTYSKSWFPIEGILLISSFQKQLKCNTLFGLTSKSWKRTGYDETLCSNFSSFFSTDQFASWHREFCLGGFGFESRYRLTSSVGLSNSSGYRKHSIYK